MDQRVRGIGAGRGGVTFMGPRRRDARRRGAARAPTHTHTPARVCAGPRLDGVGLVRARPPQRRQLRVCARERSVEARARAPASERASERAPIVSVLSGLVLHEG